MYFNCFYLYESKRDISFTICYNRSVETSRERCLLNYHVRKNDLVHNKLQDYMLRQSTMWTSCISWSSSYLLVDERDWGGGLATVLDDCFGSWTGVGSVGLFGRTWSTSSDGISNCIFQVKCYIEWQQIRLRLINDYHGISTLW